MATIVEPEIATIVATAIKTFIGTDIVVRIAPLYCALPRGFAYRITVCHSITNGTAGYTRRPNHNLVYYVPPVLTVVAPVRFSTSSCGRCLRGSLCESLEHNRQH